MKIFPHKCNTKIFICLILCGILIFPLITILIHRTIALYKSPQPQAILTLGGGSIREKSTAKFAQSHPFLDIWVSTGIPPKQAKEIFRNAGINLGRVNLDYRAVDTVTNFTSLVQDFKNLNIHHLYLITSDFHMRRVKAIATVVLGSRGIAFTPGPIPTNQSRETNLHVLRDTGRALIWHYTGHTGASLNPEL